MTQTPNQHRTAHLISDTPPQLTPQTTYAVTPGLGQSPNMEGAHRQYPHLVPPSEGVSPLRLAGLDPLHTAAEQRGQGAPRMLTTHQVKSVPTFSGKERHGPRLEDWIRDMRFLLGCKGTAPGILQFHEAVRHTGGKARDVLLNLESRTPEGLDAEKAFVELLEEYGEDKSALSPVAKFYARVQRGNETPMEFAIGLESTLREVEETRRRRGQKSEEESRDKMLATQFMVGLKNLHYKQRLAPMQPRFMAFRDVRRELHIIDEEERQAADLRRQQTSFSMSEVAQSLPQVKAQGKDVKGPAQPVKEVVPVPLGPNDPNTPIIQQLMTQQLEEMKGMHRGQMEALDRVLQEQRQHGQRLARLEGAVFQHQPTRQPQSGKPPYTGCFNCGDRRHLARNCPQLNHSEQPQQQQAPTTQPMLNGQNLRM
ncbi:uncharacterized protein LOC119731892 [Patiria miniata]|uniref:CCHC-type domain-containing protein n=1 Tax=Patiria miniata TaxID=46514 RepID=A0A914ACN0_PATMI|nr:uncharacterized protein LOC119731892 [Patiria miniata]